MITNDDLEKSVENFPEYLGNIPQLLKRGRKKQSSNTSKYSISKNRIEPSPSRVDS
jgi:hypothetical protein